jgi:hypothetical protein
MGDAEAPGQPRAGVLGPQFSTSPGSGYFEHGPLVNYPLGFGAGTGYPEVVQHKATFGRG